MSETLLTLFEERVARYPRRTALRYRSGGIWRARSWTDWKRSSRAIAAWLCSVGVEPGDRVAILAKTSIHWVETDLGILTAGAATVPIYSTLLADTVGEIVRDSGAKVLFASDPIQVAKVFTDAAGELPDLERVVSFDRVARLDRPDEQGRLDVSLDDVTPAGARALTLTDVLEARAPEEILAERAAALTPESLAAVYYTSGTSGEPKGVMLTHDNIVFETAALYECMPVGPSDEQLLFLPLAHIVAKLTMMLQLRAGYVTSFAQAVETAAEDCASVRPTFVAGVPRVFEKIQELIERTPKDRGDVQQRVFDWALGVGREVSELRQSGREPGTLLAIQHRSAERLVFSRIKERLGGRIRFMLSGAAPLAKETAELFHALDLLVLEGYGLTESTGASTLNTPRAFRFGTVGLPLPGVEVKVAEGGEILLAGRSMTKGYWRRDEETKAAFTEEGLLRTGDVGEIDADGFLRITDREKDLIITAGGKNIAPQRVELRLKRSPYIDRAIVLGDRRKFVVALIVPSFAEIYRWADEHGLSGDSRSLVRHPRVRALLAAEVAKANEGLATFESVKRFDLVPNELSVENGTLTPTGKIRRSVVALRYADLVDALYEGVTSEIAEIS